MNEIAIIEFESFQENIALDDTALPFLTQHRSEGRKQRSQLKRKTFSLFSLSQIVMSNEENHIILRTPSN
jgi:hypothetical protein